ncbi:hypothetical protein SMICM304S_09306 [Streptomyces microflavus]
MDPVRLALTMGLVRAFGLDGAVDLRAARPLGDSTLRLVHRQDYVSAVRAASADPRAADQDYGLGTVDDPAFEGMHEASALIAGLSVGAAEAVWRGETAHAVNFTGGLHHAMPGAAAGFCIYNDPALAIARLLELGAERVAYVDVDVHHGDGVQAAFWEDPQGADDLPARAPAHSGRRRRSRRRRPVPSSAEGSVVNLALPAGPGDAGWLRAFLAVGARAAGRFPAAGARSRSTGPARPSEDPLAPSRRLPGGRSGRSWSPVMSWRTGTRRAGGGWRSAGAGTRWWRSCRGRGRIWWGSPWRALPSSRSRLSRRRGATCGYEVRRSWAPARMTRSACAFLEVRGRTGTTRRTGCRRPGGRAAVRFGARGRHRTASTRYGDGQGSYRGKQVPLPGPTEGAGLGEGRPRHRSGPAAGGPLRPARPARAGSGPGDRRRRGRALASAGGR